MNQDCWQNDPATLAWMKSQGMGNNTDLVYECVSVYGCASAASLCPFSPSFPCIHISPCRYFVNQVDAISLADGKIPVRWEEVWTHFGTLLDKRTIIHAWLSTNTVIDATSKGYQVIWSIDGLYYLDNLGESASAVRIHGLCRRMK